MQRFLHHLPIADLLNSRADKAIYEAKESGKSLPFFAFYTIHTVLKYLLY
jgi:hypothetical protein